MLKFVLSIWRVALTFTVHKKNWVSVVGSWFLIICSKRCYIAVGCFEAFRQKCHLNSSWWQAIISLWPETPPQVVSHSNLNLLLSPYCVFTSLYHPNATQVSHPRCSHWICMKTIFSLATVWSTEELYLLCGHSLARGSSRSCKLTESFQGLQGASQHIPLSFKVA